MSTYRVAYYCLNKQPIFPQINEQFNVTSLMELSAQAEDYELLVIGAGSGKIQDVLDSLASSGWHEKPVVMLVDQIDLQDKLKAFDAGVSDCIEVDVPAEEIIARCTRLIFDYIANQQLKSQMNMATQTAMQAMSTTSDLGNNIQFFIDSQLCNSLDELGMRLLQSTQMYGLKVSLQLRGAAEVKNMEQNGLAKPMESQLLAELANSGRYFDFGKRTVMNYEQVSILVKNMPVDDPERYGALKDNVFSLLQAADARLKALDTLHELNNEKALIVQLVNRTTEVLKQMEQDFLETSKSSAGVVAEIADNIEDKIQYLGLNEDQEEYFLSLMQSSEQRITDVFAKGLKSSEHFRREISVLDALSAKGQNIDIRLLTKFLNNS